MTSKTERDKKEFKEKNQSKRRKKAQKPRVESYL